MRHLEKILRIPRRCPVGKDPDVQPFKPLNSAQHPTAEITKQQQIPSHTKPREDPAIQPQTDHCGEKKSNKPSVVMFTRQLSAKTESCGEKMSDPAPNCGSCCITPRERSIGCTPSRSLRVRNPALRRRSRLDGARGKLESSVRAIAGPIGGRASMPMSCVISEGEAQDPPSPVADVPTDLDYPPAERVPITNDTLDGCPPGEVFEIVPFSAPTLLLAVEMSSL